MRVTDGKVIADVKVFEFDPASSGFTPDWSEDFFNAGLLRFNDDLDACEVRENETVQDYVDSAEAWANGEDDSDTDYCYEVGEEAFQEEVDNRRWSAIFYSPYYPNLRCETYEEALAIKKPKYFLDLKSNNRATLYTIEGRDEVWSGQLEEAGVEGNNDSDYTNKLDDFFQKELNIAPNEWGVG